MPVGPEFPGVLAAARTGESWAWERLFESVARPLRAYAAAKGSPDPGDLCGEVLLRVVRDLPGFEGDEAGFRSWAFTIAHHRLVDERRHRSRADLHPLPARGVEPPAETLVVQTLEASGWTRRLARLPVDQRHVLLLRIVAGLDTDETAHVLDRQSGHVRVLLHRALKSLRTQLEQERVTR